MIDEMTEKVSTSTKTVVGFYLDKLKPGDIIVLPNGDEFIFTNHTRDAGGKCLTLHATKGGQYVQLGANIIWENNKETLCEIVYTDFDSPTAFIKRLTMETTDERN